MLMSHKLALVAVAASVSSMLFSPLASADIVIVTVTGATTYDPAGIFGAIGADITTVYGFNTSPVQLGIAKIIVPAAVITLVCPLSLVRLLSPYANSPLQSRVPLPVQDFPV
jgi:hypothetical protein